MNRMCHPLLLLFCLWFFSATGAIETKTEDFILNTSGSIVHEFIELDEILCTFTYAANLIKKDEIEKWKLSITKFENRSQYTCKIENALEHSKAIFEMFSASFEYLKIETAEIFDNNGALLQDDEYVIHDNFVMQLDNFKSNIVAIQMVASDQSEHYDY